MTVQFKMETFMQHRVLFVNSLNLAFEIANRSIGSIVELEWVKSYKEALEKVHLESYDLFIIDIELLDGSGVELCGTMQYVKPEVPVVFFSDHCELSEKVLSFSSGAEDYISFKTNPLEFRARIEARLKKTDYFNKTKDILRWDEIEINKSSQTVRLHNQGKPELISLTALEFKLLCYLAKNQGDVISRDRILDHIWGKNIHIYPRSVDTHVSKLRRKLGQASSLIQSVHGSGYKFSPTYVKAS